MLPRKVVCIFIRSFDQAMESCLTHECIPIAKIDKYGRPTKSNVKKDLQRFYKLEDEEETKDKDERETSNVSGSDQEDEKVNVSSEGSENEDELNVSEGSDEDETEAIPGYDLARGEGLIESSDEEEGMQDVELDEEEDDEAQEEVRFFYERSAQTGCSQRTIV